MDSLEETISCTCHAYPNGIKSLASALSINPGTLYNKCNSSMTSHHLNIQEALDMMRHTQDFRILETLCRQTHHACVSSVKFQNISDMVLFEAWTACDMEHGITAQIIREALEDGCINKAELKKIRSEMFIDFARELELLDRLKQLSGDMEPSSQKKLTLSDAIHVTIQNALLELPEIASNINVRDVDLQKKSDPTNANDILTVQETLKLMRETKEYTILYSLAEQLNHTCVVIPHYKGIDNMLLLDAWSKWNNERSETVSTIHSALMKKAIKHDKLIKIEKEMFQDFHTELALLARLKTVKRKQ